MPAILVNDVSPVISYVATASQTLFAVPFEFFSVADIVVQRQGTTLTYSPTPANNNQYSVTGANAEGGGSITLGGSGASLSDKIIIYRDVKIERLANYPETGPMAVRSLNAEQAKHIAMLQQLERDVGRGLSVPIDESSISLPSAANRANKVLTFDGSGNVVTTFSKDILENGNLTPVANGGTGATTAAGARTNLGASTLGSNVFTIANPSAVTFPRFNADNTVSALDASTFRSAIGAGTGGGSVTSVVGAGTVSGLTLTGTVTSTGSLTLGGTLSVSGTNFGSQTANQVLIAPNGSSGVPTFRAILAADIPTLNQNTTGTASNVTGTVAVANGGTGATTAATARTNLGAAASNTNTDITSLNAVGGIQSGSPTGGAKGTGTINATGLFVNGVAVGVSGGSVSSVAMTVPTFLSVTGSPITTSGTLAVSLSGTALPVANGGTGATTLTSGYLTKGNGASAISASVVYDDGTNVGIGTISPSSKLDVNGKITLTGGEDQQLQWTNNSQTWRLNNSTAGQIYLYNVTGAKFPFKVDAATASDTLCLTSAGVGIGTQTPGAVLQLNKASGAADLRFSVAGTLYANMYASSSDVNIYSVTAIPLILGTNNTERMRIASNGFVGVGTSTDNGVDKLTSAGIVGSVISGRAGFHVYNGGATAEWFIGQSSNSSHDLTFSKLIGGSYTDYFAINTTGGITSASIVDAVGYKGLPQNSQTASYTLALTDMGKMINTTTGGVVIPANGSVAFPIGSTVIVYNNSASSQTISITTDTLYLAGTATTGSRTLAQRGLATLVKVTSTNWVVSGAGVT